MMAVSLIVLLYIIILTIMVRRNNQSLAYHTSQNYRATQKWSHVILYNFFFFSLLVFEVLLVNKLDYEMSSTLIIYPQSKNVNYQMHGSNQNAQNHFINSQDTNHMNNELFSDSLSYFSVTLPLYVAYVSLMCLSFNSHSGNMWWFGMRRDFCDLFLVICPLFKIYGNVQLKFSSNLNDPQLGVNLNDNNQSGDPTIRNNNLNASVASTYSYPLHNNFATTENSNDVSLVGMSTHRAQNNTSASLLRNSGDEENDLSNEFDPCTFSISSSNAGVEATNSSINNNRRIKFSNKKSSHNSNNNNNNNNNFKRRRSQQRRQSRNSSNIQFSVRSSVHGSIKSSATVNYVKSYDANTIALKPAGQNANKFGTIVRLDLPD